MLPFYRRKSPIIQTCPPSSCPVLRTTRSLSSRVLSDDSRSATRRMKSSGLSTRMCLPSPYDWYTWSQTIASSLCIRCMMEGSTAATCAPLQETGNLAYKGVHWMELSRSAAFETI